MLPEIIVVGDVEWLFIGMGIALGMPGAARRALNKYRGVRGSKNE
jgi:hypothetical protein